MLLIRNLHLRPGEREAKLKALAARALRAPEASLGALRILRKSLDARRKNDIHWTYTVVVSAAGEERLLRSGGAERYVPFRYEIPKLSSPNRPVVAGFGPAGMFAALALAEAGLRPIVLERGADVDARLAAVRRFWETGALDPETNVQFGEGGAGTFSDGKLATNTHDPRIAWVLERFREFGAGESVVYDAKPHVGTDRLTAVVKNLRRHVTEKGGEVRFLSRLTGLERDGAGLSGAVTAEGHIPCRELILAVGHSARDTFAALLREGVAMERKPFSMGVRIEHSQAAVDAAQYGRAGRKHLPPADYKANVTLPDGRGVYTFCMCPGGYVVGAAGESGGVATNGMSYSGRAGDNANAALLVTLRPEDFPGTGILAGMEWQRELERACFVRGGGTYRAPAQTVADFLAARKSAGPGSVEPTYRPGVAWGELREALPPLLTDALAAAIPLLAERLRFFSDGDAVLTAPETRSSSPVRILRAPDTLQSPTLPGLYPCGEGAGYAGGITSAAVDGLRVAEAVMRRAALRAAGTDHA